MSIKQVAKDFFAQTEFQTGDFVKYRGQKTENGGISFGGNYCNEGDIQFNTPEYQLFCNGFYASFKYDKEWINIWAIPYNKLMALTKKSTRALINWGFYNYVELDGLCFVFNNNRWDFKKKLKEYYPDIEIKSLES